MEFDAFFAANHRKTVASVFVVVGSLAEAEDVVQEAYQRAAAHWETVRHYDSPEAWVRRVAYNLALSSLRRARRRAALLLREPSEQVVETAHEDAIDLHRALRRLPMKYRAVLALRYLCDFPVARVAEELDLPVETVRSQLARGRQRLEAVLREADRDLALGALEVRRDV